MNRYFAVFVATLLSLGVSASGQNAPTSNRVTTGAIKGHVRLNGKLPGNSVIRMNVDPKCAQLNRGKQVVQEAVKASIEGNLANVFVRLEGTFPKTPPPSTPVIIDQRGCVYSPRVVGVQVGQMLQIKNSDDLLHNVHSVTNHNNQFNFGQVKAGVTDSFKMKEAEVMMRLGCDVHRWMRAYVGVVTNPFFSVSDTLGNFQISGIPPGTYSIRGWHERYGPLQKTVTVTAGKTTIVDFDYTGNEPAPTVQSLQESAQTHTIVAGL